MLLKNRFHYIKLQKTQKIFMKIVAQDQIVWYIDYISYRFAVWSFDFDQVH